MKSYWLWEDEDGLHADGANPEDWPKEGSYVPAAIAEALLAALLDLTRRAEAINEATAGQPFDAAPFSPRLIAMAHAAIRQARGEGE